MKVLITGFEPFNKENINPSWEAVRILPDEIDGHSVVKLQLPTVFSKSSKLLIENIKTHNPDIVISVGEAGNRTDITIERVAINIDDAKIEDNEGNKPIDKPIVENGNGAYFSTLPIKDIVENIKKAIIPASVSNTAGTYVCNHIMYSTLHYIKENKLNIKSGFIHVPYLPIQVLDKKNTASMEKTTTSKALEIAIKTTLNSF